MSGAWRNAGPGITVWTRCREIDWLNGRHLGQTLAGIGGNYSCLLWFYLSHRKNRNVKCSKSTKSVRSVTKCAGTGGMFNMLTNIDNTEQGAFQPSELMEVFSGHQHCSLPFLTLTTVHFSSAEPSLDRLHVTVFKPVEFVFSSRNILMRKFIF